MKGDLGVQRGMVIWFLSRYSATHSYIMSPQKVAEAATAEDELPEPEGVSSVPPTTAEQTEDIPSLPPAFTPSIKKTLANPSVDPGKAVPPLPAGVTVSLLQSRLSGKKTAK